MLQIRLHAADENVAAESSVLFMPYTLVLRLSLGQTAADRACNRHCKS